MRENQSPNRPMAAIALYTDGVPWYPYRRMYFSDIRYTSVAKLPDDPGFTWTRLHRLDRRLHVDLFDDRTLAELLYCTPTVLEPGSLGSDTLMDQLRHTLTVCRCNPNVLAGWVAAEYGDHLYDLRPNQRMVSCRALAKQLTADYADHPAAGVV